jgi:fructose-1,6-bisphosphatase/inositol monophosphatase family enzyme
MIPDVDAVIRLAREVAAAEVMSRYRNLSDHDIRSKNAPHDLVTTADIEAERRLAVGLSTLVPDSLVVGEEAAEGDPGVLAVLAGADPVWLIDPVDGTGNFARGEPCFATIIAYCVGGETVAGWILDPVSDRVAWAVAGEGAWMTDTDNDRRRLAAAAPRPVDRLVGSLGYRFGRRLRRRVGTATAGGPARIVRYGCTGREYMDLAEGRLDFAHYRRLKPWDHAAGVLIHGEAGGYSRIVEEDTPYRPEPRILERTVLLAPDKPSWTALCHILASLEDADMIT